MYTTYRIAISGIVGLLLGAMMTTQSYGSGASSVQQVAASDDIRAIAVLPFRNATSDPNAGMALAEQVARGLASQGHYRVYGPNGLKSLMGEHDMAIALNGDQGQVAQVFQKTGRVQAVLMGTVTQYSSSQDTRVGRDPVYEYRADDQYVLTGYRTTMVRHNEGIVTVSAALIRVSDGVTLRATPTPITARETSDGNEYGAPGLDPQACLTAAARNAAGQLIAEFAMVRRLT